jgi:L-rhamnose mutarotase
MSMSETIGLHTLLRPGCEARYDEVHAAVWPEVLDAIRGVGVTRWLIYRSGLDLFHLIECDDYDRAIAELAEMPINTRWQAAVAPMMAKAHDYSGESSDRMSLIFDLPPA